MFHHFDQERSILFPIIGGAVTDFIEKHWNWIASDPVAFITLAAVFLAAGFLSGRFFLKETLSAREERLNDLKAKLEDAQSRLKVVKESSSKDGLFIYPDSGFHGDNILARMVAAVKWDTSCSMVAVVPAGSRLRVHLRYLSDKGDNASLGGGAWSFSVAVRNWQNRDYDFSQDEQWFEMSSGDAEMNITFRWRGVVAIEGYESNSQNPSWVKRISVE